MDDKDAALLKPMTDEEISALIDGLIDGETDKIKEESAKHQWKTNINDLSIDKLSAMIDSQVLILASENIIGDLEQLKEALKTLTNGIICKKIVWEMIDRIYYVRNKPEAYKYKCGVLILETASAIIDKIIAEEKKKEDINKDFRIKSLTEFKELFKKLPSVILCEQIIQTIYDVINQVQPPTEEPEMGSR
jgi:hypothetical protein